MIFKTIINIHNSACLRKVKPALPNKVQRHCILSSRAPHLPPHLPPRPLGTETSDPLVAS